MEATQSVKKALGFDCREVSTFEELAKCFMDKGHEHGAKWLRDKIRDIIGETKIPGVSFFSSVQADSEPSMDVPIFSIQEPEPTDNDAPVAITVS